MKANLLSIPLMLILSVLQTSVISRIHLINGSADLILITIAIWGVLQTGGNVWFWAVIGGLFTSLTSAMPPFTPIIPLMVVGFLARGLHSKIWQSHFIAAIIMVFIGTIIQHVVSILALQFSGVEINFLEGLQSVTMPSLFLNILFSFPMFVLITDISKWIEPQVEYE